MLTFYFRRHGSDQAYSNVQVDVAHLEGPLLQTFRGKISEHFNASLLQIASPLLLKTTTEELIPVTGDEALHQPNATRHIEWGQLPFEVPLSEFNLNDPLVPLDSDDKSQVFEATARNQPVAATRLRIFEEDQIHTHTLAEIQSISSALLMMVKRTQGVPVHENVSKPIGVVFDDVLVGHDIVRVPLYLLHEPYDCLLETHLAQSRGELLHSDLIGYGRDLTQGLAHLHQFNMVHRHLTLDCLRFSQGRVKLAYSWDDVTSDHKILQQAESEAASSEKGLSNCDALGRRGRSGDVWNLGRICLHIMGKGRDFGDSCGPDELTQNEIDRTLSGYDLRPPWSNIIRETLQVNPGQRSTVRAVLSWFPKPAPSLLPSPATRAWMTILLRAAAHERLSATPWVYLGALAKFNVVVVAGTQYSEKECYLQALSIDPKHASAWRTLGYYLGPTEVATLKGVTYTKAQCYVIGLSIDPTHSFAWNSLGCSMDVAERVPVEGRDFSKRECFLKALSLDCNNTYAMTNLGTDPDDRSFYG